MGESRSKSARDLIRGLLQLDPRERLTASQSLRSEWLLKKAPPQNFGFFGPSSSLFLGVRGYTQAPLVLRAVLLMCASRLSDQEVSQMVKDFNAIDVDQDGFITSQELEERLLSRRRFKYFDGVDADEAARVADLDGDGVIGFTEFVAAALYCRLGGSNKDFLRNAFDLFDTDNDGVITRLDMSTEFDSPQMCELEHAAEESISEEIMEIFPDGPITFDLFANRLSEAAPGCKGLRFTGSFTNNRKSCGEYFSCSAAPTPKKPRTRALSSAEYDEDNSDIDYIDEDDHMAEEHSWLCACP